MLRYDEWRLNERVKTFDQIGMTKCQIQLKNEERDENFFKV